MANLLVRYNKKCCHALVAGAIKYLDEQDLNKNYDVKKSLSREKSS